MPNLNTSNLGRLYLTLSLTLFALLGFITPAKSTAQSNGEHLIISGGVALRQWENLRAEPLRHDRWWGNFIRPARGRIQQLRKANPNADITWMVHRNSYITRGREDNRDLLDLIRSVQTAYNVNLVYFNTGDEVINYINNGKPRSRVKITSFDYYGHSNKFCFMFDYSNHIYGASKSWLHQVDLVRIKGSSFSRNAYCKSWGCHTGESMSTVWRRSVGNTLVGAKGKTDYADPLNIVLSFGGSWTNG